MAKHKSNEDLESYLREHLKYERDMLRFTYDMLFQAKGYRWCAFFESFGLHARNLYDFLRHEGNAANTVRADDYVKGRKKPDASNIDVTMNRSLFHLSTSRLSKDPLNMDDAAVIGSWIDREWAIWVQQLREPFNKWADLQPACLHPAAATSAISATNYVTTTSSGTPRARPAG